MSMFRALAVDFDGTLTRDGRRPAQHVLDALARVRAEGCRVLLVTGRILSELRADFPDVEQHVDAIVAENGCVLHRDGVSRTLAPPVPSALAEALRHRDVPLRTGDALIACDGHHAVTVLHEIERLGLDCQIVHNRAALMVLPAGVTKGSGLYEALGDLGISRHSAIGVGDAENDHSLLDVCEVGVAVGNAVPALARHADIVLVGHDGDGVVELLEGPVFDGKAAVHSARWQMVLGTDPAGGQVTVPTSPLNLLVCGNTGLGKSHAAGLVAERLIALGYCVLVIDPEGDHRGLGRLRGVVSVDAAEGLPSPSRVAALVRQRFQSVVLDLSCLEPEDRRTYLRALAVEVGQQRADVGLPHWIVMDEAHMSEPHGLAWGNGIAASRGHVLVTYRPEDLGSPVLDDLDGVLALCGDAPLPESVLEIARRVSGLDAAVLQHLAGRLAGHDALLVLDAAVGTTTPVRLAQRTTPQVRHAHKYGVRPVSPDKRFYVRDDYDNVVDVAGSMAELCIVLARIDEAALRHHARGRDLSHWVAEVFADRALAGVLEEAEADLVQGRIPVPEARARMLAGVARRYPA